MAYTVKDLITALLDEDMSKTVQVDIEINGAPIENIDVSSVDSWGNGITLKVHLGIENLDLDELGLKHDD